MNVAGVEPWMLTAGANAIMVAIYGTIAVMMVRNLVDGAQWRTNPIATATAAIFVTCTVGHGLHLAHVLLPVVGVDRELGEAARVAMADWRLLLWDGLTAVVAIWYWTLRNRFAVIFGGAALCEDMAKRQAEAAELHDNVVQGLARAKLALDLGQREEGARAVEETLASAKSIITGLLGAPSSKSALASGDLRRDAPGR